MFVYIARDDDGELDLFVQQKPIYNLGLYVTEYDVCVDNYIKLDESLYPEIKPGECRKFKLDGVE